ncbi:MAG: protein arginine kinase [Saccharofermentanales bacterium]
MTWYIDKGPESDVILSSRVRLARNLCDYPFPNKLNRAGSEKVAEVILGVLKNIADSKKNRFRIVDMNELGTEDKLALVEKHLISEELTDTRLARYAFIKDDESVSVMVNEEDHIRIQAMEAGLNLEAAFSAAQDIAIYLEKALPIGYHDKYGFTTACPTNTGTGMRASVIMHLPALAITGKVSVIIEKIRKMGYSVRGYYGEHSNSAGNMFQISNQITLGLDEQELISDLKKLINQITKQERALRKELYEKNPVIIEDKVFRSLGLLKYAKILTSEEALRLISDVRMGKALGIIKNPDETSFNRIMSVIGPASIQKAEGRVMDPGERDKARATEVKKELDRN